MSPANSRLIYTRGKSATLAGALALLVLLGLSGCDTGSAPPAVQAAPAAQTPGFELEYERLSAPIAALGTGDRDVVRDTIQLIRQGEHALALNRLSSLTERNPQNSGLRILASYALLEAGNLAGAFEQAEKAHQAPDRNSYTCWFLGKVALLSGNREVCERELHHLERAGPDMLAQERALEEEFVERFGPLEAEQP